MLNDEDSNCQIEIASCEKALLHQLQSGDSKAFRSIYIEYVGDLYRYARKTLDNKEDCEEIIQEVFTSLWARHGALGEVVSLRAYLFRMVKYQVIRYIQKSKVRERYAQHYALFEAGYELPLDLDGEEPLVRLERGLRGLPERCREAVLLRLREDLSNTEIAQRMQITKKTVEVYMVKAFAHLRSQEKVVWEG